jgi:hypothetical protein
VKVSASSYKRAVRGKCLDVRPLLDRYFPSAP